MSQVLGCGAKASGAASGGGAASPARAHSFIHSAAAPGGKRGEGALGRDSGWGRCIGGPRSSCWPRTSPQPQVPAGARLRDLEGGAEDARGSGTALCPLTPPTPPSRTSTWGSSQVSRRTDFTLLTWGMLRWIPEQLRQMNTPRV